MAINRALEIDDGLAEGDLAMANFYFYYKRNWAKAIKEFKRAIELNPNRADTRQLYALFLSSRGVIDEGIREGKIALELDPVSLMVNFHGWIYFFTNRFDDMANQVERLIEIEPNFHGAYWLTGMIHLATGDYEKAIVGMGVTTPSFIKGSSEILDLLRNLVVSSLRLFELIPCNTAVWNRL